MALNYQGTFDLGDLFKNSYQQQQSNQIMQQAKLDEMLASAAHNSTQAANAQKSLPTDLAYKQSMTDVNNANVKTALSKLSDEEWNNAITAGIKTTQALASTAIALGQSGKGGADAYQNLMTSLQSRLQGMKPDSPEYKQTVDSIKQIQSQQQQLSSMTPQDLVKWGTDTNQHLLDVNPAIYKEQIQGQFGLKKEQMQQEGANWRTKYSVDAMNARSAAGKGGEKAPKTSEEALVRSILADDSLTPADKQAQIAAVYSRKTEKPIQAGITPTVGQGGQISLENKPTQQPFQLPNKATQPQGATLTYVPGKGLVSMESQVPQ